jgi:transposase InsO family protein
MRGVCACGSGKRRDRQSVHRLAEHAVKRRALAFHRRVAVRNASRPAGAKKYDASLFLSLGRSRLDHWRREWRAGALTPRERGRPCADAGRDIRAKALELLDQVGPSVGAATLGRAFPELGVNEARRVLAEYRDLCRSGLKAEVTALEWLRPGAVWAMDHAEPPEKIEGEFACVLVVRDLASRQQLAALAQRSPSASAVADALEELFIRHGAPLVLKSDNGGAFTGLETRSLLERWGVRQLLSPPYLPRYNGAVEAGIGQLKTRAHLIAARHDRPGRWTADDLEGALLLANRTLRPWGKDGPTPEECWQRREPIARSEREEFLASEKRLLSEYARRLPEDFRDAREYRPSFRIVGKSGELPGWTARWNGHAARSEAAGATGTGKGENDYGQGRGKGLYWRKLRRKSLTDAMVARGLLAIKKRVVPLPIKRIFWSKIS